MKFKLLLFVGAMALLSSCNRDKPLAGAGESGNYFPVKEYTLKNGLKVFISVNKNAPRIQTAITVKAGSKFDPPQTTGLAHYLEHMLFKGTAHYGTSDYAKEKPYLDALSDLFEKRRMEPDEKKKKALYKEIDSLSREASKYAIPNEYDKMIASLGAKGTNAFTDRDLTCYVNDIPSNGLEKWLAIEGDRFQDLELRIFHTELEAVYEEFNRNTAEDAEWSGQAVDSLLMPNHPYGSQTTIGLSSHLKNPSMVNIHNYFNTYYVPNNCAIVLSGDLDPDATIALIEKYFGSWKQKEVPPFVKASPVEIKAPLYTQTFGHEPEHVYIGYRFGGADSKDYLYVKLIDAILANGKGSGLIDLNLKLKQKLIDARSEFQDNRDYTVQKLYGQPKEGQKLEEVKDLLIAQVDSVKQGRFPDWLLPAIIANMKLDMMKQAETNQGRVFDVVFAFVKDIPLERRREEIAELSKITKADIVKFANANYGDNYAVCYKRMGEPKLFKVDKPEITPVELNKEAISAFRAHIDSIPFGKAEPKFCDFANDIKHSKLAKGGVNVDYIYNDVNKTFSMNYIFDMGTDNNKKLGLAFEFLPYLGTDKYDAAQIKQEFYKLGLSFGVYSSRDQVYVSLSGLEEHLDEGIKLFEYLLANVKPDQEVYDHFAENMIRKRADSKLSKDNILFNGMISYGQYGAKNPFNDVLSNEELKAVKADELVAMIKSLHEYKHKIFYYGSSDLGTVVASLDKGHLVSDAPKEYPVAVKYPELPTETQVYYATYPMKQAEIVMYSWDDLYNPKEIPALSMFNEYYGGNMSSVLFQEIREKRALAYSVFGRYGVPAKKDERFNVLAYVGTQSDKMETAVTEVSKLLNDLPEAQKNFDMSKQSLLKGIESDWITRDGIYWAWQRAQRRGLDYDIRKDIYTQGQAMTMKDVHTFFDQHVKGKKYVYLVLGGKGDLNLKALAKMGPVKELSLEQIFGY